MPSHRPPINEAAMQVWKETSGLPMAKRAGLIREADPDRFCGMKTPSILGACRTQEAEGIIPPSNRNFPTEIPELVIPWSESFMVLPDAHFPLHHKEAFKLAMRVAVEEQIKIVIWPGDILDNGYKGHKTQRDSRAATRAEGVAALSEALYAFDAAGVDEHVMMPGNHDDKPLRGTDGELLYSDWIAATLRENVPKAKLTIANRYYVVMEPREPVARWPYTEHNFPWRFTHQKNYSKVPLSTAREICNIKMCHAVCAHQHHHAVGWASNGVFRAVDAGCMQDSELVAYKEERDSRHPEWNVGFTTVTGGQPKRWEP